MRTGPTKPRRHGPDERTRKADLRLDSREIALTWARSDDPMIAPGRPDLSHLIERVSSSDAADVLPPPKHGKPLSPEQINLLIRWVEEGAEWREHWAFRPPEASDPPGIERSDWPAQPIDTFLLAGIEKAVPIPCRICDMESGRVAEATGPFRVVARWHVAAAG